MAVLFKKGTLNGKGTALATQIYPSEYARTKAYPHSEIAHQGAAEDAEATAVRCAQCGAPIEDSTAIDACWHCESDNFLGAIYSR